MDRINFTAERVTHFRCEPGRQQSIFWDAKTPGLGLRATIAGAKSYIFETRLSGKTLRLTIGDVRAWSIGDAQTEARRLKTLTDQGIDPREQIAERRAKAEAAKREAHRQDATVSEAWAAYLSANCQEWGERHYQDHIDAAHLGGEQKRRGTGTTKPGALAPLMRLKLTQLTAETVAAWLKSEVRQRPTRAAQAFRKLRAFIRWCEGNKDYRGIVPADAYSAHQVHKAVPKPKAKDDCLQREQLHAWFNAVRQIRNPVISAYLQGLLLTGARREELAGLRWTDVDFQWNSLTIKDKVDGQRIIPLTPYVSQLLAHLPRRNQWVFSSPTAADGKLTEPRIAHAKALQEAGLPVVSLHGLRRSFGTLAEWVEVPTGIVAQIMGHKPSALAEKHYRVRPLDLLRMWHTKIEGWMLLQAGIQQPENTTALTLHAVR